MLHPCNTVLGVQGGRVGVAKGGEEAWARGSDRKLFVGMLSKAQVGHDRHARLNKTHSTKWLCPKFCLRSIRPCADSRVQVEDDVRQIFGPFGMIEECTILRGPDGASKGAKSALYWINN